MCVLFVFVLFLEQVGFLLIVHLEESFHMPMKFLFFRLYHFVHFESVQEETGIISTFASFIRSDVLGVKYNLSLDESIG